MKLVGSVRVQRDWEKRCYKRMTGWYNMGREERVERDIEGKRQVREFGIRET
jgi:hypothetical protein